LETNSYRSVRRSGNSRSSSSIALYFTYRSQNKDTYSAAWQQFLVAKRAMLAEYDQAMAHSKEQAVQTHHGLVGEAAVRDWLETFLPKRYGVAPGFIRAQGLPKPYQSNHFDVIIYDQLEAPTLWIESNKDKSDKGRARIIPAENVRAILEVKSAFSTRTVREALEKLGELEPLMAGFDTPDNRYARYLPVSALVAILFFELRADNRSDIGALNLLRDAKFKRAFYPAVILRGEGLDPDDTALVGKYHSETPHSRLLTEGGLLAGITTTESAEMEGRHIGAMLQWSEIKFSEFAFDLLAFLNGTFRRGFASSFHGLEIRDTEGTK
jgi:hypothetical protein